MLNKFIISSIKSELPFEPNEEKEELFNRLGQFLISPDPRKCFVLKGYAGTGKTSVVSALVRALEKLKINSVLLAPTGRAAKVLSRYSGYPAFTIHKWIYRQDSAVQETFSLADNRNTNTLFIVDEASMIPYQHDNSSFGSGSLLNDLVRYVYNDKGCSLLLLGDDAQLPPVGTSESMALEPDFLAGYGLNVSSYSLIQVVRQALDSGILRNATKLRNQLKSTDYTVQIEQDDDIREIHGTDVQEVLEKSYREVGDEDTIILTRSNKRTNLYNQGVRARVFWKEDRISNGDRLMVSKNNYYWTKEYDNLPFLANGDIMEISRLRNERELYGFHFADASLRMVDYDYEIDAVLWIDTLFTDSPDKSYALQRELYTKIAEDYPEITNKKDLAKVIRENEYYNALLPLLNTSYSIEDYCSITGERINTFLTPCYKLKHCQNEEFFHRKAH